MSTAIQKLIAHSNLPIKAMRLNLGCGVYPLSEGFINIDRQQLEPHPEIVGPLIFRKHNLEKGIPYDDKSIDYIVCHHFLEHFTYEGAYNLLDEIARVLRKGGQATIVTPDFHWIVDQYLKSVETIKDTAEVMIFCEGPDGDRHRSLWDHVLLTRAAWGAGLKVTDTPIGEFRYMVAQVPWQCGILVEKK